MNIMYVIEESSDEILLSNYEYQNCYPSKKEAAAAQILPALLQMRDIYNGGWEAEWNTNDSNNYCIFIEHGELCIANYYFHKHIFAFKTYKLAEEFLNNFRTQLEIVKPLL